MTWVAMEMFLLNIFSINHFAFVVVGFSLLYSYPFECLFCQRLMKIEYFAQLWNSGFKERNNVSSRTESVGWNDYVPFFKLEK